MVLMAFWGSALAEDNDLGGYYHGKEQGWFWRETMPFSQPAELPEAPDAKPAAELSFKEEDVTPRPFSAEWMRQKLPELRDRALQEPTPDNVRAYYYLQRYAVDMAERFALVAQKVVLADPSLDENARRPISTYGGHVFDEVARENTLRVASKIASTAGLWYFFKSDCPFCAAQNPVLERLQRRIGLAILPIALDQQAMPDGAFSQFVQDRGHAAQLNVTKTPTLYLVRRPGEFVLLSEGLVTDDGLLERIVHAGHDAKWISDEEFDSTRATRPADVQVAIQDMSQEILDDPVTLIEVLKSKAKGRRAAE